jgi:integrase
MAMKSIDFTKLSLEEFQLTASFGEEAKATNDKRWRIWKRKKGLSLGFELHHRNKVRREVIGRYGDITLREYKLAVTQVIAEAQLSRFRPTAITFGEYFGSSFLEYSKRHHRNQKSILCNYNRLSRELKGKDLDKIKRGDIESELNRLREKGLSNASCNRVLAMVKKLFNLALADELIITSGAKHIKPLKETFKPSISLSDAVFGRYVGLAHREKNTIHAMALILDAATGCRIGEIMGIRLGDISDDLSSFLIRDTKNGESRTVCVGETGSKAIKVAMKFSFNEFLFSSNRTSTGFIGYPRGVHARIVNELNKEFDMEMKINIKDLRSTVGTKIYEQTGDIKAVQQQLGHKTIDLTARRYIHPSQKHQMKTVNGINDFFK